MKFFLKEAVKNVNLHMILKVYVDTTNTFCLVAKRKKNQFLSFFEMSHLIEQHPEIPRSFRNTLCNCGIHSFGKKMVC